MKKFFKKERFSPFNFGCLPEDFTFDSAKVIVLPIPYETTSTYRGGTKDAPLSIIASSRFLELYDEEIEVETYKVGIYTLSELEINLGTFSSTINQIKKVVKQIISKNKFPVILGGEHSISLGCVQAFFEKYPDLCVLQLDAHADLRDSYQGTKFSHACVGRRILEIVPIIQVGIRSMSYEESIFIKNNSNVKIIYAKDFQKKKDEIINLLGKTVYLSFDLDFFDPSIMPTVGTPEPGGLFWYETLEFLKELNKKKNVVGIDIVELTPLSGVNHPDFLAAKLIYKLIGYKFFKEKIKL